VNDPWISKTSSQMQKVSGPETLWAMKSRTGVGCDGSRRLSGREIRAHKQLKHQCDDMYDWIVQPWMPGQAFSRSAIVDRQRVAHWLPVTRQHLSITDSIAYQGGCVEPELAEQIPELQSLLETTLSSLGGRPRGWIGIDFLWDDQNDEQPLTIIEINPRLTTSFVGLCAAGAPDLAAAIVAAALGQSFKLPEKWDRVNFTASGETMLASPKE
jgi:predicted ATP-grasp superfamily ATP-dependent carboligase